MRRVLIRAGIGLGILVVGLPVFSILVMRWVPPPITAFMARKWVRARFTGEEGFDLRYRWTGWDGISPHARIAVVAAEDQNFPRHSGFDVKAIEEAWEEHEQGGRLRGASTISQQVAKNLFLWPGRSFVRKGLEAYLTAMIEFLWPKRRILEVYLNTAEMGRGIYGVTSASRVYFGKSPATITAHEAALLAAVLPNPVRLHADHPSPYVLRRASWIEEQMRQLGGGEYLEGIE